MTQKFDKINSDFFHKTLRVMLIAAVASSALAFTLFRVIIINYEKNTVSESSNHLIEISRQLKVNVEQSLNADISRTKTLARNIPLLDFKTERDIFSYLHALKQDWNVDSIRIYNYAGVCLDDDGLAQNSTNASQYAYETVKNGDAFHVTSNFIEYSVAVDSPLLIHGTKIAAVAIVRDLDNLIKEMHIQSFGDRSAIYLTQQNGIRISQTANASSPQVFNITALFSKGTLYTALHQTATVQQMLSVRDETVYMFYPDDAQVEPEYVVITPVAASQESWFLLYGVPAPVVNRVMKRFSARVLSISIFVDIIVLLLFIIFFFLYKQREDKFNKALASQTQVFDLLVSETNFVFMLVSTKKRNPIYLSSNAQSLLGTQNLCIDTNSSVIHFEDAVNLSAENEVIDALNSEFEKWNGKGKFTSGFIPCGIQNSNKFISLRFYPVEGKRNEYIGVIQDVTVEQEREDELKHALVLADAANRAKTKFLSSMSHDIRTPMNAIVNMTSFAEESCSQNDNEKTMQSLSVIKQSSHHLLELINDILDMSRIESGRLSFAAEPFNISTAISSVSSIILPLCAVKHQIFTVDKKIFHEKLLGDELRLNQILINLLNNAVKFTPEEGHISFSVEELHSIISENASYRFTVADTGIGIAPENRTAIFEPFSRVDTPLVRRTEGTGLGLAITKRLVEAMGGSISLSSELGKGSTFTIELFFAVDTSTTINASKDASVELPHDNEKPFAKRHALLAEDNELNRMIAITILEKWGFSVDQAVDGNELIEKFSAGNAPLYDIIYTDIQMPGKDGYEAATQLRTLTLRNAKTVPIIALTADVFAEDIEKARKAGMNAHVNKPLDPAALFLITKKLLSPHGDKDMANAQTASFLK